jgi:sulfur carrier protein
MPSWQGSDGSGSLVDTLLPRSESAVNSSNSITVNGEATDVPQACTVAGLLEQLQLGDRRVAVALNSDVVPSSAFALTQIATGDRIEILEAVGGG